MALKILHFVLVPVTYSKERELGLTTMTEVDTRVDFVHVINTLITKIKNSTFVASMKIILLTGGD